MPRPRRPWFRLYTEALHDRKLRRLPPAHRWLWVAVLAMARQSPEPGVLLVTEGETATLDDVADTAALPQAQARKGMAELERLGMVERTDGRWSVPRWSERQYESDDVTARTRKHRSEERGRNVSTSPPGTGASRAPATESEDRDEPNGSSRPDSRASRDPNLEPDVSDEARALTREFALAAVRNGHPVPKREQRAYVDWLVEMDRLLRLGPPGGDPTPAPATEVRAVIAWCAADDFERANVLSVPKLRKRYSSLRLKALGSNGDRSNGHLRGRGAAAWDDEGVTP